MNKFDYEECYLKFDGEIFAIAESKKNAKVIGETLIQLSDENKQLKTQIKIFEKFLDENDLDIDWEIFCTVDECKKDSDDYGCKECKYLGDVE